ncbi:PCNA-associated factor isoform X2 [Sylvia atricapilla]|uniref:PCNA-associated factor isoform X2 n=1 Tax=Sylvia atricapilla TaxID=48155 RepID=UPI0033961B5E
MARTKVDQRGRAFRKVLVARAPRKALGSSSINARPPLPSRRGDRRPAGLNRVCVRPVPAWQRGIGDFLKLASKENRVPDGEMPGPSSLEYSQTARESL